MLLLLRKINEGFWIGENIAVKVRQMKRQTVILQIHLLQGMACHTAEETQSVYRLALAIGESFWLNGEIELKLVARKRRKAMLGIQAPPALVILRTELREKLQTQIKQHTQKMAALTKTHQRNPLQLVATESLSDVENML